VIGADLAFFSRFNAGLPISDQVWKANVSVCASSARLEVLFASSNASLTDPVTICHPKPRWKPLDPSAVSQYHSTMRNITVAIDEETYLAARVRAAAQGSSISALVKQFLKDLTARDARFEALAQEEENIRARIEDFDAAARLPRGDLYRQDP
jgi:plasmid stability protein